MNNTDSIKEIEDLLNEERAEEARSAFEKLVPDETENYHFLRGRIEHKFQNWGDAINAYNKVLALNPENSVAKHNLELIQNILNFWNPDMFNP